MATIAEKIWVAAGANRVDPMARAFLVVALTFGAAALALIGLLIEAKPGAAAGPLIAIALGFMGALGAGAWLVRRDHLRAGVAVVLAAGYLSTTAYALFAASGVLASAFSFYGLLALAAGILLGARAAWIVGIICVMTLIGVHAAESAGWIVDPAAGLRPPPSLRVGPQLILLASSVLLASLFSRALAALIGAAREQEQRFRRLLAIGAEWYWEQDREHRLTRITPTTPRRQNFEMQRFLGKARWEIPDSGLAPAQWDAHRADLAARRPFRDFEIARTDLQGRRRFISTSGEPTFDAHGEFAGYWGVGRDVTAEVEQRRSLQESEARFRALLAIAADWYWEQDAELRLTKLVGEAEQTIGVPAEHMLGKRRWEIDSIEAPNGSWDAHRAVLAARRPFRDLVLKWHRLDGGRRYISVSGEPNFGPDGEFRGYWGVGRDVTAEQSAQRALEASERRYRVLFDRSPLPKVIHRHGVVLMANEAAAKLLRQGDPVALVGAQLLNFFTEEDRPRVAARIAELSAMAEGEMLPMAELQVRRSDATVRTVQATGVRVLLNVGLATLSMLFDISERKQAEAALRRSEEMLSRLFEASPDAIVVSDVRTSRLVKVNERFVSMFGYVREELIGRTSLELGIWVDPAQRAQVVEAINRDGIAHGIPVTRRTRDGRLLSVRYSAARMRLEGEQYMIVALRDVTEQEREQLQQQAMLANAWVGIAFMRDRAFQLVNPHFESMFGWAPGALVGQPGSVVWPSADAYAEVGRMLGPRLARGELVAEDLQMCRRDGTVFWCRIRARAVDPTNPVSGGTIWIAEDVTAERAAAEQLAAAKEAAEQANRAKSEFLATMSHEIRTPLTGLLGLTKLALREGVDAATQQRYLRQIQDNGKALHAVISDVLDLSKIEAGKLAIERVDFDLHALLESLAASYRELAQQQSLAFELHIDPAVAVHVTGDPTRIRQLLSNYLSNALKFTARGAIRLRALAASGCVRFEVIDTGAGIAPDLQAQLFKPFTQGDASIMRRFGGTGLGLSICRQIAQLMGGAVGVASAPGAGSTFWAELPLPQSSALDARDASAAQAIDALRGVRVLLAEDNPVNRLVAETFLSEWGAQVIAAADGSEAVAAVEAQGAHFDVVLMDLHMPVMGGIEAAARLRHRFSAAQLPILALTAAALEAERGQCLAAGMNDFVAKPFNETELLATLLRWTRSDGLHPAGAAQTHPVAATA